MSWQTYVDSNLVGAGLSQAAILGHDGNTWATSAGFQVTPAEGQALVGGFRDAAGLRAAGLSIANAKYITLKADDRSIYGKKGAGGVITVKTGKAVLIGVYDEKMQPGQAANIVEKLADYLISVGY